MCVWVCDKVSDDAMNKDERDERDERERERRSRREKFGGSGFCDQIRMRPSKRNTLKTTIKAIKWSYPDHGCIYYTIGCIYYCNNCLACLGCVKATSDSNIEVSEQVKRVKPDPPRCSFA